MIALSPILWLIIALSILHMPGHKACSLALVISFAPEQALAELPPLIRPILGNGFVMGTLTVLLLEHVIFKDEKKSF